MYRCGPNENKSAVMATVVLALGDGALQRLCDTELFRAGHAAVAVTRALELLQLARRMTPDVVLVDETPLGRDVVKTAAGYAAAGLGSNPRRCLLSVKSCNDGD